MASAPTLLVVVTASEDLAAGAMVSFWNSGGPAVRNANAADATKPTGGFVSVAVTSGGPATVYLPGAVDGALTGLTPGAVYYLDTVAGGVNSTAPSSSGNLVQQVGVAATSTQLIFMPQPGVTL